MKCTAALLLALFLFIFPSRSDAQAGDSCRLRLSLLTCGPGEDLYSLWGHTGIRLIDSTQNRDLVFNYGTFDDRDPLFYVKFTRGIMMYSVMAFSYPDFMEEYRLSGRSVREQELNLSCDEKVRLAKALITNAQPENMFYAYHFYGDNCTTRARNIIARNTNTPPHFSRIVPADATYRQLIHSYMNSPAQAWNRLGIDILLGRHLDEKMDTIQTLFLPEYLMKGFDEASIQGKPLVSSSKLLLVAGKEAPSGGLTPAWLFTILLLLIVVLWFLKAPFADGLLRVLDFLLFFLVGLLGVLILTLWIIRVDNVCRNNYNLIWALPSHCLMAFWQRSRKSWIKNYWLVSAALGTVLLVGWKWVPQEMNPNLIPLVVILVFRSLVFFRQQPANDRKIR